MITDNIVMGAFDEYTSGSEAVEKLREGEGYSDQYLGQSVTTRRRELCKRLRQSVLMVQMISQSFTHERVREALLRAAKSMEHCGTNAALAACGYIPSSGDALSEGQYRSLFVG